MHKIFSTALGVVLPVAALAFPLLSSATSLSGSINFNGKVAGDLAGYSVSSAGDVNGDGFADLLVGSPYNDDAAQNAGAAFLIYGDGSVFSSTSLSTAVEFRGEEAGDLAGISVSGAGDINSDGYDDLLIGASNNGDTDTGAGAAYVVYGSFRNLESESLSSAIEFAGEEVGDAAGTAVAGAGDINGDGFADFVVGAPDNDDAGVDAGAVYIIYGRTLHLSNANLSGKIEFTGEAAGDLAGTSVVENGDVNQNGYNDILVGAPGNDDAASGAGSAYVIYGQANTLTSASLSTAIELTGEAANDQAGTALSMNQDLNADGYSELMIGAPYNDDGGLDAGAAYIVSGQSANLSPTSLSTTIELTGKTAGDLAGMSLGGAGDMNGDSYADALVGAPYNDDAGADAGAVFLLMGSASTTATTTLSTLTEFVGGGAGYTLGQSVAGNFDMNGDGYSEIFFGIPRQNIGSADTGRAALLYVALDKDQDTVLGEDGMLFTGIDCDDTDPDISGDQIYYADEDGDGLGDPDHITTVCSDTTPSGYVTNHRDTNDLFANNGIEISGDHIDNDGDDEIDEYNTLSENGAHPAFGDLSPRQHKHHQHYIKSVSAGKRGHIHVKYKDNSIYNYVVFNTQSIRRTHVKRYGHTGFGVVVRADGREVALMNLYSGTVLKNTLNSSTQFTHARLKLSKVRGSSRSILVLAKRPSGGLVSLYRLDRDNETMTQTDTLAIGQLSWKLANTKVEKPLIFLRNSNKTKVKTIHVYAGFVFE